MMVAVAPTAEGNDDSGHVTSSFTLPARSQPGLTGLRYETGLCLLVATKHTLF